MRGKPLIERLVPGFSFQIQSGSNILLDFNPYLGYKLNGRFILGFGWNERIAFNWDDKNFVGADRIYGGRSFLQFKVKEGLHLKVETEIMNAFVPSSRFKPEPGSREWVWSYFAGIKRDFRFSKNVMGNVQVLYNLYDPKHQSPYPTRFVIRMGFEFPLKRSN